MRNYILCLLLLALSATAQTYYAVWNSATLRYEFVRQGPGTVAPNVPGTITISSGLPYAVADTAATLVNTSVLIPVLQNDIDTAYPLSIYNVFATNATAYAYGTNVFYTPPLNFIGANVFGYTVTDGFGNYSTALVRVIVTNGTSVVGPTNGDGTILTNGNGQIAILYPGGAPVAVPDSYAAGKNHPLTASVLSGLVSNQGNPLVLSAGLGTNMTITTTSSTTLQLLPNTNYLGTATGQYVVSDTYSLTNVAGLSLLVTNINPVATNDFYNAITNTVTTLYPITNDFVDSYDVANITSIIVSNGAATLNGNNSITFTAGSTTNTAYIWYTLRDSATTSPGIVTILVTNMVSLTTNSLVPNMTSANTPSGYVASASTQDINDQFYAYEAFTTSGNNSYLWQANGSSAPQWVQIQLPLAKTAVAISFGSRFGGGTAAWIFAGSNDGSSFTNLASGNGPVYPTPTTFSNGVAYLYYRLTFSTAGPAGLFTAMDFQIYGY